MAMKYVYLRFSVFNMHVFVLEVLVAFCVFLIRFSRFGVLVSFFAFLRFPVFSVFAWPGRLGPSWKCLAGLARLTFCSFLFVPFRLFPSLPFPLERFWDLWWFVCFLRSLLILYSLSCALDLRFRSPRTGF